MGSQAQLDKRFCAAMYAVGLRNLLQTPCKIARQCQDEESEEFLALFPKITYLDASEATSSALYPLVERQYPLLLYKIHGKFDFKFTSVEPIRSNLDPFSVFILDNGLLIYLWIGYKSMLHHRLKSRLICSRINASERKGRARIVELDQGEEPDEFWDLLGFSSAGSLNAETLVDSACVLVDPCQDWIQPALYSCADPLIEPSEAVVCMDGNLRKSMLDGNMCFILDAATLIFLWIGKDASPQARMSATEFLTVFYHHPSDLFVENITTSPSTSLVRFIQMCSTSRVRGL
jgi:hypothetical protein